eukprot:Skav214880  [mRNA]  locus=scaffold1430:162798:165177:- [translate_table: standard]
MSCCDYQEQCEAVVGAWSCWHRPERPEEPELPDLECAPADWSSGEQSQEGLAEIQPTNLDIAKTWSTLSQASVGVSHSESASNVRTVTKTSSLLANLSAGQSLLRGVSLRKTLSQASCAAFWVARAGPGSQLANFDVMKVDCSNDFDRECIYDAIVTLYGSLDTFSAYVRGPFSQEVLNLMRVGGSLSSHYIVLPLCPALAVSLDNVLALCKAGAPAQAVISMFFNQVVALELLFWPAIGVFFTWMSKKGLWLDVALLLAFLVNTECV